MSKEFKVGDKVRVLEDAPRGQFIKGCIYEVSSVYEEDGNTRIGIVADSNGNTNGWLADNFELVESFDYLIDIAIQAVRDNHLSRYIYYNHEDGTEVVALYVGEKLQAKLHSGSEKRGIDWIKSLYTETFTIESCDDLNKIDWETATADLSNDRTINLECIRSLDVMDVFNILYGATINQENQ